MSEYHDISGTVYWQDPLVFRQLRAGDFLDQPSGTTHALVEVDMRGTRDEVLERFLSSRMVTGCGVKVSELGEGCQTRQRHLEQPNLDGHVMGGGVDCPACLAAKEASA